MTQHSAGGGVLERPDWLAAGAAACVAVVLFRAVQYGLPGAALLFWTTPLPLFAAALGFGLGAGLLAVGLMALLLALSAGTVPMAAALALFGIPVLLMLATGLKPEGRVDPRWPLALLGLWPVVLLFGLSAWLPDGLTIHGVLRAALERSMARLGQPAPAALLDLAARFGAMVLGTAVALTLLANAAAAQALLRRTGLQRWQWPAPEAVRSPEWYPALPALAAAVFVLGGSSDPLMGTAVVYLLIPLFLQGLAGVHARARGQRGRKPALALFYLMLVMFLYLLAPGLVGLGLYDQLMRRPAPKA